MIIPFQKYNRRDELAAYTNGLLPHWRQKGCSYFVTFGQADSIPTRVVAELRGERDLWFKRHGIDLDNPNWKSAFLKLPKETRRAFEIEIGKKLNKALDKGYGSCLLSHPANAKIVENALLFFHEKRAFTGDFVIMPNHVHALLTPIETNQLEDILHSVKSYTSNEINKIENLTGRFWQRESHDHIVRDKEQLVRIQKYIRNNPAKANLLEEDLIIHQAEYDTIGQ